MPKNSDHRRLLRHAAKLATVAGENRFKVGAYNRAAGALDALEEPVDDLVAEGRIQDVDGIGKSIAAVLREMTEHGRSATVDALEATIPPGVVEMLAIRGLGPKKVRELWIAHGIETLAALRESASSGALEALPGFGAKSQTQVLTELARLDRTRGKTPYAKAVAVAETLVKELHAQGVRACVGGQVARAEPWVDEVVIVVEGTTGREGLTLPDDVAVRWALAGDAYAETCLKETASAAHFADVMARAGVDGGAATTVEALYAAADLVEIPLPARDDRSLVAHREGWFPTLLQRSDLRGDLHMHTTWSDGAVGVAAMAEAAAARGLDYIAITDHSQALVIANGLDQERLRAQMDEIDAYNAGQPACRVLKGLEVDILTDGTLDMDDETLRQLDWVVASVHSSMSLSSAAMTQRLLTAISSGCIHAIGHPTGRKIGVRDAYDYDVEAVFDACEAAGVAVELNASPHRLDLDGELLAQALRRPSLWITLNTDAHTPRELDNARHGVAVAQRAWVPRDRVVNSLSVERLVGDVLSG